VHVNRAPRINPNNWVILRSLMSSLPSLTLVARMILSVQAAAREAEERTNQFKGFRQRQRETLCGPGGHVCFLTMGQGRGAAAMLFS
jgi:hypothetical protein